MRPVRVFIIAGEASGDDLGGALMARMRERRPTIEFAGVGGPAMIAAGLTSLFPLADIAVMGIIPVIMRLRTVLRRIAETAAAVIAARPDILVIIDSPDFTHRVAKRVRAAAPDIPIVNYVSPTVWAWRPGRARKMKPYVDHLLALLPFEPDAHRRLGGPPTSYVGHPLARFAGKTPEAKPETAAAPLVLVLPGSRRSEVRLLMQPFGEAVAMIAAQKPGARFVLPAVPHVRDEIEHALASWTVKPELIASEDKSAAFAQADAAIAASGTVTLELAIADVPMVVGYKASAIEKFIWDHFVSVGTIILPNLIIGAEPIPQFLQGDCNGAALAKAALLLIDDGPARSAQLAAFRQVRAALRVEGDDPSARAAEIVLQMADASAKH